MTPRNTAAPDTRSADLDLRSGKAFSARLTHALESAGRGRPSALLHLDVARAADIHDRCGQDAVHALRDLMTAMVHNQLGPGAPAHMSGTCAMTLLLPERRPDDAIILARRLRGVVDNGTFSWRGHPFRLGAHIGLVELGAQPADPEKWMHLVREACKAARELGGSGIQMVALSDHAWRDLEREREWHEHLTEVI